MRQYTQLTQEQRYHISGLRKAGTRSVQIARVLGVSKSTISRELARNAGQRGWRPAQAQRMRDARRQNLAPAKRILDEDWKEVERLLCQDFSPEEVSGRLANEDRLKVSHEWIYQHVIADKRAGGELWTHLRCRKKYRKRYGSGQERRGQIPNRISIEARPTVVDEKSRVGDWEGDLIIGKDHKGAVVTLVERKTRFLVAQAVPSKEADGVGRAIVKSLQPHQPVCKTITFDNGKEFTNHEEMASRLGADIYFAHPYHSWERGLNENTNGLLRQYLPKTMDLREATSAQVAFAVNRINHRPRKTLGFKSPYEVFYNKEMRYTKPPPLVALQT